MTAADTRIFWRNILLAIFFAASWVVFIFLMASGFRHPGCVTLAGTIAETGAPTTYRCCIHRGATYNVCPGARE